MDENKRQVGDFLVGSGNINLWRQEIKTLAGFLVSVVSKEKIFEFLRQGGPNVNDGWWFEVADSKGFSWKYWVSRRQGDCGVTLDCWEVSRISGSKAAYRVFSTERCSDIRSSDTKAIRESLGALMAGTLKYFPEVEKELKVYWEAAKGLDT